MKALILSGLCVVLLGANGYAQWNPNATHIFNTNTGNVGIGTTTPAQKLHVKSTAASAFVTIEKPSNAYEAGLTFDKNGSTQFFLYTDNDTDALKIQANGISGEVDLTPRMEFPYANKNIYMAQSGGNVGIGTSSPAEKLHIDGSIRGNQSGAVRISTGTGYVDIGPRNAFYSHFFTDRDAYFFDKPIDVSGPIGSYSTNNLILSTGSIPRVSILHANGNVGIGIPSPAYKLDVGGIVNATGLYINGSPLNFPWTTSSSDIYYNTGNVGIGVTTPAEKLHLNGAIRGNAGGGALRISTSHGFVDVGPMEGDWSHFQTDRSKFYFNKPVYVDGSINSYNNSNLVLRAGDVDRITILQSTGDIGIGTSLSSNPNGYKLAVNGKVGAHEVRVEQSSGTWPDYVFSKDYDLPSLAEVEAFITVNKHLKDVPSIKDVEENGHELGTMDAVLLKKIEELTLYIIKQEKRLDAQQEEIESLKQKK